ncbi:MAG TPA: GTPase Era [Candidatus Polarisedimenticolia bacterium]|nr:GTPase Era [Candidatus Polarisedimenticolia bacterium]
MDESGSNGPGDAGGDGGRCGFVALVGRPNVGKSTLMNRLVGAKLSIVSDVPQTTRVPVRGILHRPGLQIVFIDTPGIHKPRHRLNEEMVKIAVDVLRTVDVVAVLVDASDGYGPGDRYVFDRVRDAHARAHLVLNKIDGMKKDDLLPLIQEAAGTGLFDEIVPVSARTGENCDRLEQVLASKMPVGPAHFPPDVLTDLPQRLRTAELIREQVFTRMRQEVPHAAAVLVEQFEEEGGLLRIGATILVERDTQKGIVIGEGGRMIKEIGTAARHALEADFGRKVHLALWVKVKASWRDDPELLRMLGLVG